MLFLNFTKLSLCTLIASYLNLIVLYLPKNYFQCLLVVKSNADAPLE